MENEFKPKRKSKPDFEERRKHFNEFKGLSSLTQSDNIPNKKAKLDKTESEKEIVSSNATTNGEPKSTHSKKSFILLENLPPTITTKELHKYLTENRIPIDQATVIPGCLARVAFNRQKSMDKLFNICQGLKYKSNELFICKSLSNKPLEENRAVTNLCDSSIHVKNLDPLTTVADIESVLSGVFTVHNISINTEKRTAIIDLNDRDSAEKCIDFLDGKSIGENVVRCSFLVKSQRPDVFVLKLVNLPTGVTKTDIQTLIPFVSKLKLKKKSKECLIHFQNEDDFQKALSMENDLIVGENRLKIEQLTTKKSKKTEPVTQYVLNIFNLPFDTTVAEIKERYGGARFVEMQKNEEGKFVGAAKLKYDDKTSCEEALKQSKGLIFKHRRVRAEMKIDEKRKNDNKTVESTEKEDPTEMNE